MLARGLSEEGAAASPRVADEGGSIRGLPGSQILRTAARMLRGGGVIAYPTEGVFGLGCLPDNRRAVHRILRIKARRPEKGMILVAADREQVLELVALTRTEMDRRVGDSWPGPVTWILPATRRVPAWIRGAHDSVAIRVSAHPVVRRLCALAGSALVSTSANVAGRRPARTALAAQRSIGRSVDLVVNAPTGGLAGPSEIRDGLSGRVLRAAGAER